MAHVPKNRKVPSVEQLIPFPIIFAIAIAVVRVLIFLSGGLVVRGKQNLLWKRAHLIAANHISDMDPPWLGVAMYPLCAWFMAKEELFHIPLFGQLCKHIHAFPVVRGAADRIALRFSEARLRSGDVLAIFPEGKVNADPDCMTPFREGVAMLALRTGVPIIPAAIVGTNRAWPYGKFFLRHARIPARIAFGSPMTFSHLTGTRREKVALLLDELRAAIEALRQQLLAEERADANRLA